MRDLLETLEYLSDAGLGAFIGIIILINMVRAKAFFPDFLYSFLFNEVTYFGTSATPRLFWIGFFLFCTSVGLRVAANITSDIGKLISKKNLNMLKSDGEAYLERHGVKRYQED